MRVICLRSAPDAADQRRRGDGGAGALRGRSRGVRSRRTGTASALPSATAPARRSCRATPRSSPQCSPSCKRDQVFGRAVKVDVASHSTHMDPLVPELVSGLSDLEPRPSSVAVYSTVDAASRSEAAWDGVYWGRNLRQPVRFADDRAAHGGGRHRHLHRSRPPPDAPDERDRGRRTRWPPAGGPPLAPSRSCRSAQSLLASLGALWADGHPVRWEALFPDRHLPTGAPAALPVAARAALGRGRATGAARWCRRRPKALDDTLQAWLHVTSWVPAPLPPPDARRPHWLVVGTDDDGAAAVGAALADLDLDVHRLPSAAAAARGSASGRPTAAAAWRSSCSSPRMPPPSTSSQPCRTCRGPDALDRRPGCGG